MPSMTRPQPRREVRRLVLAGWLAVLVVVGVSYVALVLRTSDLLLWALIVAGTATLALGGVFGYRRDWRFLVTALLAGTGILVVTLEAAWIATFFVPVPGGSGGFGEIVAPAFIAVLGCLFSLAALSAILGGGVLIALAIDVLRPGRPASDPRVPSL